MIKLILICFFLTTIQNIFGQDTIYDQQRNASVWPGLCQTGKQQSPININESKTVYRKRNLIQYNEYSRNIGTVRLFNTGYAIQADISENQPSVIFNTTTFTLRQFHFHWGASEHAINNKLSDGEIHLVHGDSNDNLLVLGALLQKTPSSDNIISDIFRVAANSLVNYPSEINYNIDGNYRQLIDQINMDKYFNYMGSLTTPNCSEGVTWIVYPEMVEVDSAAIEGLKNIRDPNGNRLLYNNRDLQALNDRKVYRTFRKAFRPFIF